MTQANHTETKESPNTELFYLMKKVAQYLIAFIVPLSIALIVLSFASPLVGAVTAVVCVAASIAWMFAVEYKYGEDY